MDKKVLYALLGGAAVVGAAVAFHLLGKASEEADDGLDAEIAELGELELDANGFIEFKQFLKIFQICSYFAKAQFAIEKKQMIADRRAALKNNDDNLYKEIVMKMTSKEEELVQQKLYQILDKLGLSEEQFQRSTMFHGQDQRKGMQIMQMQQSAAAPSTSDAPTLSKQKTIQTFKKQQEIQMESMDAMMQ